MTKRKNVLKNLTNILNNATSFAITCMLFGIVGAIIGFCVSKVEPITLTENEVNYYTSQAEVGYLEGIYYLNSDIEFTRIDNNTFSVYSSNEPNIKQKLKVTFSDKIVSNKETYYSIDFAALRIGGTFVGFAVGELSFLILLLVILGIMAYIRMQALKSYDCPLNFSDEDE